ncbi:hypothetical protein TOPH_04862 [Tolypocladium ophioglossoides CBS 100239]|uniref:Uncharacterized protein n=1 Tax=Tolypocladium ophioglossoides (strain CBS 100239) TaxID=1163406 RepID=A0A0L0NA03_TOLOC|nr:hypothetical protein TOPH_04862 [Tolypocladium ophioglossoides CBS 100239]
MACPFLTGWHAAALVCVEPSTMTPAGSFARRPLTPPRTRLDAQSQTPPLTARLLEELGSIAYAACHLITVIMSSPGRQGRATVTMFSRVWPSPVLRITLPGLRSGYSLHSLV